MTKSLLVLNVANVLISDQRALESHMRVYTREQLFACLQYNTYCYNTFSTKDNPETHQNHVHAWEKPWSGKECGKCFSYHQDVERHMTIHTRGKHFAKKIAGLEHKVKYAFSGLFSGFSITISLSQWSAKQWSTAFVPDEHLMWQW